MTYSIFLSPFFSDWPLIGQFGQAVTRFAQTAISPHEGGAILLAIIVVLCLVTAAMVHLLVETPLRVFCSRIVRILESGIERLRTGAPPDLQIAAQPILVAREPDPAE